MESQRSVTTLSVRTKALYGTGAIADAIKATSQSVYLLFFYTTVLGVPARLVGLAAALSLVWDALIDPLIGGWSDRTESARWGRRHGWMTVGSFFAGLGYWALFSPPAGMSATFLFGWLIAVSLVLRTGQSMFSVPYAALGSELVDDYDARTTIVGYRAAGTQIGALIASAIGLRLFFPDATGPHSRVSTSGYAEMGIAFGALIVVAGLTAALGTWRQRHRRAGVAEASTASWIDVIRSRDACFLNASAALMFLGIVVGAVLNVYFLTYYVKVERGSVLALCQGAQYLGATAGVLLWASIAKGHEKQRLYILGCVTAGGLSIAAFFLIRFGIVSGGWLVPALVVYAALVGAAASVIAVLPPSMTADLVDAHDLSSGRRAAGTFFGVFSTALQVATGVATVVGGMLVDYYAHVVPGTTIQSAMTVERLGILGSLLPGALMLSAGLVALPYGLTRQRAADIRRALGARATSDAPSSP